MYETLEHGQGTPLLMLHGMMGAPDNWAPVFPALPSTCRAIALKFPFFEDDGRDFSTVPAVRGYAEEYLAQADFDRFVVCGNSLGGHVAIDLAAEMPDKVLGIVLTGSSGLFERTFGAPISRPSRDWVYDKIRGIFHDARHATDEMVDEAVRVIGIRRNVRTLIGIAKAAKHDNVAERLRAITCPALLVWGRQDVITPPDVAEEFRRHLPNSELVWFDECGHAPMMEHPRKFGEQVGQWWNRRICPSPAPERTE